MAMDPEATDEDLVQEAKQSIEGDARAFDQLVLRHQRGVLANCRHLSRSPQDAEDLAQEVFVKAYFAIGRFEERASFKTWVTRIKVNHCLNHLKKKENQIFVDMEDDSLEFIPGMQAEPEVERRDQARDQRRIIRQVLDSMGDTLRVPLVLRDYDKLSYQEIAEQLDIGLSAAKMRIKRAREEFRRIYLSASTDERKRDST